MHRTIRVLSVGQCAVDGPRLHHFLRDVLGARVDSADTAAAAVRLAAGPRAIRYDLVVVNRVLASDGGPGVDVVAALRAAGCPAPIMLISDLESAQHEAQRRGAIRGFGKSQIDDPVVIDRLRAVVHAHV
jgi:DNA-binding response OmpR family regulator